MSSFFKDVRFAARVLARSPRFALVAIVTLALGIGANKALFSILHAVLLRPLPFDEPDRLVLLQESSTRLDRMSVAYPNFEDWRKQADVFEQMAAHLFDDFNLTGTDMPERLLATRVSSSLFPLLGVEAEVGRFFLDGSSYTVIGVTPEGFRYPLSGWVPDIYVTIGNSTDSWRTSRDQHPGTCVTARLSPGVTLEQARGNGIRLAVTGVGVGLLAALTGTSLLASQLFGVSPRDPWTFTAIPILLLALAVVASLTPARRATHVAPMVALRHE